jgi:hypothetical protein
MFHACCVFYIRSFLQSSASNSLSDLDEYIYDCLRLSRYIHLSYVNNGVVVVVPRVLLAAKCNTVHSAPGFYL